MLLHLYFLIMKEKKLQIHMLLMTLSFLIQKDINFLQLPKLFIIKLKYFYLKMHC